MDSELEHDAAEISRLIEEDVRRWEAIIETLHGAFSMDLARLDESGGRRRLSDLTTVDRVAFECVAQSSSRVFGAGFVAAPEAFCDEPGLVWNMKSSGGGRVERLVLDPVFYEYTGAQWWLAAVGDDRFHTTGPYVDASGTNQYIVTCSRRAVRDDRMIGVIAVDILVAELQRYLQAPIASLPRGACIADEDGAVLVTNAAHLLGATLAPSAGTQGVYRIPATGWKVVVQDDSSASF